jgi:hypothetical protein
MQKGDLVSRITELEKYVNKLKIELVHENRLDGWTLEKYRNNLIEYTNKLIGLQELLTETIDKENEDLLNL